MSEKPISEKKEQKHEMVVFGAAFLIIGLIALFGSNRQMPQGKSDVVAAPLIEAPAAVVTEPLPELDKADYDRRMLILAHIDPSQFPRATAVAPTEEKSTPSDLLPVPSPKKEEDKPRQPQDLWPVKNAPYPNPGAILPFKRIIAFYGNFYAKGMGVLGEYPEDVMLQKFRVELDKWTKADPTTPVIAAVDYIAVSAQASAGKDGMYRARMPGDQIEKAVALADKLQGIVILEVQPGLSDIMTEVKALEPYLSLPTVHLAIDPEFAMKTKARPGTVVGTVDAKEMNAVAAYLATLVREKNIPPKVLVIHRYTQRMMTNAASMKPLPEVQFLIDMDGWGPKAKKLTTYRSFIYSQPVQFTGFKLFYKNDIKQPGTVLMTPKEVLELTPRPSFIQFQ